MDQKSLGFDKYKNVLLYIILFILIFIIVYAPLLLTPSTERVFHLSDAEFDDVLANNRVYLYITEDSYQVTIKIASPEADSLDSLEISNEPIEIVNSWDSFSSTVYKSYNFTLGNQSYQNKLLKVQVYSIHKNPGSYPFDSQTIYISISGLFIIDGNYSSTLIVSSSLENSLSYSYLSTQSNVQLFDLTVKPTLFEQFASLLIYVIALLYSLLLLIPESHMSLQQKTVGTITILLAFFMIENGISLVFSLIGIYQLYTIWCLIFLLAINILYKGLNIDKSRVLLLIIPLIFYLWFLTWNFWAAPRVYNWEIASSLFGMIWSLFPLILITWTIINWILFYKPKKNTNPDLLYI